MPAKLSQTTQLARAVSEIVPIEERDAPLRSEERRAADRLSERLHAELSGVLRSLPPDARTASGLARLLGVERTVCQRMVSALQHGAETRSALLTRLPGVRSLRAILEGCRSNGGDPERVGSALAAVEVLAELFERAGGGQAVFSRRLLLSDGPKRVPGGPAAGPGRDNDAADSLYEAAKAIVGRWSRAQVQVAFYRPDPDRPGMMQAARLRAFLAHSAREGALPLVMLNQRLALDGDPGGPGVFEAIPERDGMPGSFAVPAFCRGPVARLSSRRIPGGMVQIVDPEEGDPDDAYDLVTADHSATPVPLPTVEDPALHEVWTAIDYPCDHLLFDVWQHRDMARACIPSLSTHVYRLNLMSTVGERWYTGLETNDRLELLGQGLNRAASPIWAQHRQAITWMFDRLGWDPAEYVGYRCAVRRPLWRTGYLLSFDFRTGP